MQIYESLSLIPQDKKSLVRGFFFKLFCGRRAILLLERAFCRRTVLLLDGAFCRRAVFGAVLRSNWTVACLSCRAASIIARAAASTPIRATGSQGKQPRRHQCYHRYFFHFFIYLRVSSIGIIGEPHD